MTEDLQKNITETDLAVLKKTADLARLALSPEEERSFAADLARMMRFADEMQLCGADEPIPPASPVTREDCPSPSLPREKALANAPEKTEAYVVIPSFMDEE